MNLSIDRKRWEETLRKANSNCISIPAQRGRYVWLTETLPEPRRGSIVFEAKASNDIHVCLHHDSSKTIFGKDGMKDTSSPEYEILYGGWVNSKSTIRKFCYQQIFVTKDMKKDSVIRTSSVFAKYWITIIEDTIYAGIGELGYNQILQWTDENSSRSAIKYIGLSSWNAPIQFKNFSITKPFIPDHQKFTFNGRYLLTSSILSDTVVFINNYKFELHLPILYCWNPNFLEDINSLIQENEIHKRNQASNPDNIQNGEIKDLIDVNILDKLLNIIYTGRIYSTDLQEIEEIISLSKKLNVKIDYLEQYYQSLVKEIQEQKRLIQLAKAKLETPVVNQPQPSLQQESTIQSESAQRLLDLRILELSKTLDSQLNNNNNNNQNDENHQHNGTQENQDKISSGDQSTVLDEANSSTISNEQQLAEIATNNIVIIEKKNEEEEVEMENQQEDTNIEKLNTVLKENAQWSDSSVMISRAVHFSDIYLNPKYSDVEFLFDSNETSKTIFAHRAILSILSDPFLAMFSNQMKESTQKQILLKEVSYIPFSIFLEYCYKGHLEIPVDHVISLLILSDRFGINPLRESCFEIVNEYIDLENCCNLLDMANLYNWTTIKSNCYRFIESNFNRICDREEFLLMGPNTLIQILLSDDLLVSDEYQVFSATIKWIEYNCPGLGLNQLSSDENELITDILSFIRFPLMNENTLLEIKQKYSSLLEHMPKVENDIEEAILYAQGPGDEIYNKIIYNNEVALSIETEKGDFRKRNRTANNFNELLFSSFGDKNGIFYFIGCAYGTKKIWENPHKAGRIKVTMSSPISRYTKPDILVNRSFISTNYTSGHPAWCKVDLSENHQLVCNYYTIRQDGSDCFIRNWILQGTNSDDEESWVNLRVHKKDKTLFQPSQYAGWSVFGKHSRVPYRYFRIITTGPSTGGGNGHKLEICNLELYGYFK